MVWAGSLYIHSRIALLSVPKGKVGALVCCTGSKQYSNESAIISCSKDSQLHGYLPVVAIINTRLMGF